MTCWLCGSELETTEQATIPQSPPSESCKNSSCEICAAVANVDEEINQAIATLHRLFAKRRDLLSEHNRFYDLMHRLPVELKMYIFQLVPPAQNKCERIVMPANLTSICRNWRDVAFSIPSLWSTIHITLPNRAWTSDPSWSTKFVHDWILRSQTLPLNLEILLSEISEEEWIRVLDVISPSSDRWHSLHLAAPPNLLGTSYSNTLQYGRLRILKITSIGQFLTPPISLLNQTMRPEEIQILGTSFKALPISWKYLTSATVYGFTPQDITQLFQHASRMTNCHIGAIVEVDDHQMSPVIHQNLKSFTMCRFVGIEVAIILDSLTLPSLQEFRIDSMNLLTSPYLPELVRRSSCPLASVGFLSSQRHDILQPLPGVTDVFLDNPGYHVHPGQQLLLEGNYLPDLRRVTFRLRLFLYLWRDGTIRRLLDRMGPRPDGSDEGRVCKLVVVDPDRASEFDDMWRSEVGKELEALNIVLREDGFEILA